MRSNIYEAFNVTSGKHDYFRCDIDRYQYQAWIHHHFIKDGKELHFMIKFVCDDLKALYHDCLHSCRATLFTHKGPENKKLQYATFRIQRVGGKYLHPRVRFSPDKSIYLYKECEA